MDWMFEWTWVAGLWWSGVAFSAAVILFVMIAPVDHTHGDG